MLGRNLSWPLKSIGFLFRSAATFSFSPCQYTKGEECESSADLLKTHRLKERSSDKGLLMESPISTWVQRQGKGNLPNNNQGQSSRVVRFVLLAGLLVVGVAGTNFAFQWGTAHPAAKEDALRSIPLSKLEPAAREKVLRVLNEATFFRRLPTCVFQCDPELYLFLVRHPDVIVGIWRLMGVTKIEMEELRPGRFSFSDGEGTQGTAEYLYSSHDIQVIYTDAIYEGPLFNRTVRSRGVIVLRSGYVLETNGHYYITARLDVFLNTDRGAWETLTKTLHPLVGRIADANFSNTAQFVAMLYQTAWENPQSVQRLPERLAGIRPEVRQEFASHLAKIREKASTSGDRPAPVIAERSNPSSRK